MQRLALRPTTDGFLLYANGILEVNITLDETWQQVLPAYLPVEHSIMKRFADAALKITICLPYGSRRICSGVVSQLAKYVGLLYGVVHRWKSLSIDARLMNPVVAAIGAQLPYKASLLEKIGLISCDEVHDLTPTRVLMASLWNPKHGSQLYELMIDDTRCFDTSTFRDLPYHRLTRLDIASLITDKTVIDVLAAGVNLQKAVFSSVTVTTERIPARNYVHTNNLRSLKLATSEEDFDNGANNGAIFSVMRRMRTPNLVELSLAYEDQWPAGIFQQFAATIAPKIRILHLIKLKLFPKDLQEVLESMPQLTHLFVDAQSPNDNGPSITHFTEKFLDSLMIDPHQRRPILCPNLRTLSVDGECLPPRIPSNFRRMVMNRYQYSALREINFIDVEQIPKDELRALLELNAYGVKVNAYQYGHPPWDDLF